MPMTATQVPPLPRHPRDWDQWLHGKISETQAALNISSRDHLNFVTTRQRHQSTPTLGHSYRSTLQRRYLSTVGLSFNPLDLVSIIDGLVHNIIEATCQARKCAFSIRKGFPPEKVCALFGGVQPSWRHVKRVRKILKAELWRQARLLYDRLRVVHSSLLPQWQAAQDLRWLRQQLGVLTEVRWKQVMNPLLKVFDKQRREQQNRIVVLHDTYIPAEIKRWLRKGPKFAVPPRISAHELVGINRDLSVKANQDRDRCLQDDLVSIIDGLVHNIIEATCQARKCAFSIRKGFPPEKVCALFGGVQPSWRHVKRVRKILKAELWRQARLLYDRLRVVHSSLLPQWQAAQDLRWLRQQLGVLTEVRWKQVMNPLLKVFDKQRREQQNRIVVLQDTYIPAEIKRWLRKGPKFAVPPRISAHELVGINRDLSVKANQDRDRCLQDGGEA
ncbi:hypothetical protein HPB51_007806 [Rhipicephalus microplus]|uniref:Tick transposon n=1 Tax=Rhipicephalus microplus TaxID=6941 RepID=A0A9J6EYK9_RHIMP|nr:hypothetical protein HPB51_007806 [Rhipicephalus microplus]